MVKAVFEAQVGKWEILASRARADTRPLAEHLALATLPTLTAGLWGLCDVGPGTGASPQRHSHRRAPHRTFLRAPHRPKRPLHQPAAPFFCPQLRHTFVVADATQPDCPLVRGGDCPGRRPGARQGATGSLAAAAHAPGSPYRFPPCPCPALPCACPDLPARPPA